MTVTLLPISFQLPMRGAPVGSVMVPISSTYPCHESIVSHGTCVIWDRSDSAATEPTLRNNRGLRRRLYDPLVCNIRTARGAEPRLQLG